MRLAVRLVPRPDELQDPQAEVVDLHQFVVDPPGCQGVGAVQQHEQVHVGQAVPEGILEGHGRLDRGGVEEDRVLALRELVEEILGDPPGVGASIADEGLAQLSGQAEGAEHVAGDLFIVPLESVDRLELVGDEVGEAADVLDQGEDRGPDGLQPAEQLAVGLARIVLPAEPQPDGTLLMLVELVRVGRRDDLEILVRVEP